MWRFRSGSVFQPGSSEGESSLRESMNGIGRFLRGFAFAFAGIMHLVRTQRNARVHLAAMAAVIAAGCWLGISAVEWCLVSLSCGLVLAAEAANTAIEQLADRITAEKDERVRMAKDAAAGAVLLAALAASAVGVIVFWPRLEELMKK